MLRFQCVAGRLFREKGKSLNVTDYRHRRERKSLWVRFIAMARTYPDGLGLEHIGWPTGWGRMWRFVPLLLLALLLGLALSGAFGGGQEEAMRWSNRLVSLDLRQPAPMRNGEMFETRLTITPRVATGDLVLALSPGLWRDMTINSFHPEAASADYQAGLFRFSYGPRPAGKPLVIILDGQVNPQLRGGTTGDVAIYDGERRLMAAVVKMQVLP